MIVKSIHSDIPIRLLCGFERYRKKKVKNILTKILRKKHALKRQNKIIQFNNSFPFCCSYRKKERKLLLKR